MERNQESETVSQQDVETLPKASVFCILALTISVSPKKSKRKHKSSHGHGHHKTPEVNESPAEDLESPAEDLNNPAEVMRAAHSIKTDQLDLSGRLRKTFAMEVLLSEGTSGSRSCSPLAALMPLAKLAIGATAKAEKELLHIFGAKTKAKLLTEVRGIIRTLKSASGINLNLASKIFVTQNGTLNKNFVRETQKTFQSSAQQLDFDDKDRAEFIINEYIKNETDGLTSNPYELQLSPGQKMVILNIVTMFGNWRKKFTKVETGEFHALNGVITVPMMTRLSTYNYYKSDVLQAELIEVPYDTNKASFLIVLPYSKVGLSVLLKELKLAPDLLNTAISKMRHTALTLTMPKFKLYDKLDLKPVYKWVGMNKLLDSKSGLTKIVDGQELPISTAWQLTYIDVSEGTDESAGANAENDPVHMIKQKKTTFTANRPFLFYVTCKGEQILAGSFSGNTQNLESTYLL